MSVAQELGLDWWESLKHFGLLIAPPRVRAAFSKVPQPLPWYLSEKLRREVVRLESPKRGDLADLLEVVLEHVCGLTGGNGKWLKGAQVSADWTWRTPTGEAFKPRRVWQSKHGGCLPVFVDQSPRLGVGRGRRPVAHVLEWLRTRNLPLALLTNGNQWRLVYAGTDHDAACEWDTDLWFAEGEPGPQVTALRLLISATALTPPEESKPSPLHSAILDSRKGQNELSAVLGERVRQAVELLIQSHGPALDKLENGLDNRDIYNAAVRSVMRLVIALFAEARGLLPIDRSPVYYEHYSLTGLRDRLERDMHSQGLERLRHRRSAWPRILAMFRLIYQGCPHPDLSIPPYGGELFAPGAVDAPDALSRALTVFESACFDARFTNLMSDAEVREILEKLSYSEMKVRQGRGSIRTRVPVDFSDLRSEYIGILYEGLLDYELRKAGPEETVVFLAVGNEPALPLARLEDMDDNAIAELVKNAAKASKGDDEDEEDDEEAEPENSEDLDEDAEEDLGEEEVDETEDETAAAEDPRQAARQRAREWAERAVRAGKIVPKPRSRRADVVAEYDRKVQAAAREFIRTAVLPGQYFLVRWGGTRKGSGTFYTRPQLAIPTVHRTLRPLAYDPPLGEDGEPDIDAPTGRWTPKKPEEILALKVCDPAVGSGSFPVAALRFLTGALRRSLEHHGRLTEREDKTIIALAEGRTSEGRLDEELLPCKPDDPEFVDRLTARLRRYIVERCLYGVDLDPLAIELAKIALWIETMDRELPFSFLDHKFKCGNALVGCWFDRFRHYPVMAWLREGGDKNHSTAVHFKKDARTKAIKTHLSGVIKPDLIAMLDRMRGQDDLFVAEGKSAQQVHDEALAILEQMHHLPPGEDGEHRRAELFRQLRESPAYVALKRAFDLWCALWFWPADDLTTAPKPSEFAAPRPESIEAAERIAAERRFFHWELEFPDVFAANGEIGDEQSTVAGFDAILGNPPWDTLQPNSKEWFSNVDPLYRAYGKQEALAKQRSNFAANQQVEQDWLEFNAFFKDTANWVKVSDRPFGDRLNVDDNGKEKHDFSLGDRGRSSLESSKARHSVWAKRRAIDLGYADPSHPFGLQGDGKPYTYKLFTELALSLLRPGGRLGFVLPSGLYTDLGTTALRTLLLSKCRWEWLFGFENRDKVFDIDSRFKFNPIIVVKGGRTDAIRTAFMQRDPDDWAIGTAEALAVPYAGAQVERFSPRSKAILEIRSPRDLAVLEKIYANSVLLGDQGPDGWGIRYAQGDFNMTSDSALFPPRPKWEERGYRPDEYSRWIKGDWRPVAELRAESKPPSTAPLRRGPRDDAPFHNAPPYQPLPVPRADLPPGVILSRDMSAFIREEDIDWEVETVKDENGNEVEVRHRAVALPLYEGRMIGQLDFSQKGWVSGKGRTAVWREIAWTGKQVEPQYLIGTGSYELQLVARRVESVRRRDGDDAAGRLREFYSVPVNRVILRHENRKRVAFMDVGSATNKRTMIAASLEGFPCGNSAPVFFTRHNQAALTAVLGTFSYDLVARGRCGGLHLNYFVVEESALPIPSAGWQHAIGAVALRLSAPSQAQSTPWVSSPAQRSVWRSLWALSPHERLRLRCILDAVVAAFYGLDLDDLKWILKGCDHPVPEITNKAFARKLDPKGFWRVDKAEPPERRHTVLTLAAFADLQALIAAGVPRDDAIAAFCGQPRPDQPPLPQVDGMIGSIETDGWMLPDHFRLADLGLGHDDRAQHPQPVAPVLGPRFYDWQLAQDPAESWRECELHARNLLGEEGFQRLKAELEGKEADTAADSAGPASDQANTEAAWALREQRGAQGGLFDQEE